MKKILDFKTVCECNRNLGCKTWHPQVSIINLENLNLKQEAVKFDFYTILLIEECPNSCCCGRKYYDYSNATMVFLKPNLLSQTSLKSHIQNYTFFQYRKEEALHLSQRETSKITCCLENIEDELHHPIDTHSNTILSKHIELFLDYCTRYYERQFITRENKNKAILKTAEKILDDYIASGRLQSGKIPTPYHIAGKLHLSAAYFNDLLKFETGKTWEEYFQFKQLEKAKHLLQKNDNSPIAVAKQLGYPNVQYFSFIFKKVTGCTPNDYRHSQN